MKSKCSAVKFFGLDLPVGGGFDLDVSRSAAGRDTATMGGARVVGALGASCGPLPPSHDMARQRERMRGCGYGRAA